MWHLNTSQGGSGLRIPGDERVLEEGSKPKRPRGCRHWGWGCGESVSGWSLGWTWVHSTCLLNREVRAGWSTHPLSPRWALRRVRAPDSVRLLRASPPSAGEHVGRAAVCARLQAEEQMGWGGYRKDTGRWFPSRVNILVMHVKRTFRVPTGVNNRTTN